MECYNPPYTCSLRLDEYALQYTLRREANLYPPTLASDILGFTPRIRTVQPRSLVITRRQMYSAEYARNRPPTTASMVFAVCTPRNSRMHAAIKILAVLEGVARPAERAISPLYAGYLSNQPITPSVRRYNARARQQK